MANEPEGQDIVHVDFWAVVKVSESLRVQGEKVEDQIRDGIQAHLDECTKSEEFNKGLAQLLGDILGKRRVETSLDGKITEWVLSEDQLVVTLLPLPVYDPLP